MRYLLCSLLLLLAAPVRAQLGPPPVGLVGDSTRPMRAGQAFPFAHGVSMELSQYRLVRRQAFLADTVLLSKNRRIAALQAELLTARQLYQNCTGTLAEADASGLRQGKALAAMTTNFIKMDKLRRRAGWNPFTPISGGAFLLGLAAGLYAGFHL